MEDYILSSNDSFSLYKILYRVIKIFEKNDILYWATGGTFLGAIRCKGIIKWDDDLDLCVLLKDRKRLINIIKNEKDLIFDDFSTPVNKIRYKKDKFPFVDIFFMVREIDSGQNVYKCALKKHRELFENEEYLEREILSLKKTKFGAFEIVIPNEYERYFLSNFGKNWNKEGVIHYDHKNERHVNPHIRWKLKKSDYEPATPFYIEESVEDSCNKNTWWRF
jgi:phosphorylcholine metabolism protein LicD